MPKVRKKVRVKTAKRKSKSRVWKYRWVGPKAADAPAPPEKPAEEAAQQQEAAAAPEQPAEEPAASAPEEGSGDGQEKE